MSEIRPELKYLISHEWLRVESDGTAFVGISDHAQDAMGDLVFVETPEVGSTVTAGEEAGVVESVKAASDIYAPVSGEVVAINEDLEENPEAVNNDPYGDGWMFQIKLSDPAELESLELLSADDYVAKVEEEEH
ncbi:glycine cleavage system protein H [Gammaproteobacteria bacterium 42_54_T18]|nr:glycine cleavage system protein H [Gammaproteobacteria bacterium 42_54_T18]